MGPHSLTTGNLLPGKNISMDSMFFLFIPGKMLRLASHFSCPKSFGLLRIFLLLPYGLVFRRFRFPYLRGVSVYPSEASQYLDNCIRNVNSLRSSPRPISIAQLRTLLHFHLRPIDHVVFMGSYSLRMGDLILKSASRLDAFSVYPIRTWLPSYAVGTTTDTPLVRPSRSSRTEDSSSQISCAHDG